jgi:hypothetical protein
MDKRDKLIEMLRLSGQLRQEEIDELKAKVEQLEAELAEAQWWRPLDRDTEYQELCTSTLKPGQSLPKTSTDDEI